MTIFVTKYDQSDRARQLNRDVAAAEKLMGRSMTAYERDVFCRGIPDDAPVELRPVRKPTAADLASHGEVTLGYAWTVSDWLAYLAPWTALGFLIGAVIVALIFRNT